MAAIGKVFIVSILRDLERREKKYPALPAKEAGSKALRTPNHPESQLLKTEGSIFGLLSGKWFKAGDTGKSADGFADDDKGNPRQLLHAVFTVQRQIAAGDSNGLLVSWKVPDAPRLFFERIARWGYPWRFMCGGRHEFSISEPFQMPGEETTVEVRFSSAHDYELVHMWMRKDLGESENNSCLGHEPTP